MRKDMPKPKKTSEIKNVRDGENILTVKRAAYDCRDAHSREAFSSHSCISDKISYTIRPGNDSNAKNLKT